MSEQVGGHLQIPTSYDFKRNSISHYRNNSINSNIFHQWVKDNMYASSYAKHHSPVTLLLVRIQLPLAHIIFQAMQDSFLQIELKVYMQEPSPTLPKMCLPNLKSIRIEVDSQQLGSTLLKMH